MSEDVVFCPAVRENTAVILALCGGSGSGKTKSALELAVGLAGDGKILVIDSEGGRAKHYADEYSFLHYDWQAPYSPESLGRLLRAADQQKVAVVIVDSMSSEHEDEGGLCDMAEAEYQKQKPDSKNSAAAWAKPKSSHKHNIVRWLRTARCHVIFSCRASEKVRFERVERNGRMTTVVVPIGWTPIAEKNLLYDVTTSLLFTADNPGFPQPIKLYKKHQPFFPPDQPITREAGRRLSAWAAGGAAPAVPDELLRAATDAARNGKESFRTFWRGLTKAQRGQFSDDAMDALEATIKEADEQHPAAPDRPQRHHPPEPQTANEPPPPAAGAAPVAREIVRERLQASVAATEPAAALPPLVDSLIEGIEVTRDLAAANAFIKRNGPAIQGLDDADHARFFEAQTAHMRTLEEG